jgi:hypothetical protein
MSALVVLGGFPFPGVYWLDETRTELGGLLFFPWHFVLYGLQPCIALHSEGVLHG